VSTTAGSAPPTCPYIGIVGDAATHYAFPVSAHRCHAGSRPIALDHAKQALDCLTTQHVTCPRYHPPPSPTHGLPIAAAGVVVPGRALASAARTPPRRWVSKAVLFAVLLLGAIVAGLYIGSVLGQNRGSPTAGGDPATGATQTPTSVASAPGSSPSDRSQPTPSPTAAPTPTPTPESTPTATPKPASTPLVYIVKRGDTLTAIAIRYGVSVASIRSINDIPDPNVIVTGQRIVIPG